MQDNPEKNQGFSRVMHDPARASDEEVFQKPVGRVGSDQKVWETLWVESGRVKRFSNIAGRAGSPDTIRPTTNDLTRGKTCIRVFWASQIVWNWCRLVSLVAAQKRLRKHAMYPRWGRTDPVTRAIGV